MNFNYEGKNGKGRFDVHRKTFFEKQKNNLIHTGGCSM